MKNIIIVLLILVSIGCGKSQQSSTPAQGGDSSSGGGSGTVSEFFMLANKVLNAVGRQGNLVQNGKYVPDSYKRIRMLIEKMEVQTVQHNLYLDNKLVTAINHPQEALVVVNTQDWEKLDQDGKLLLVAHELMGLTFTHTEIDDSKFLVSRKILEKGINGQINNMPLSQQSRLLIRKKMESVAIDAANLKRLLQDPSPKKWVAESRVEIITNVLSPTDVDDHKNFIALTQLLSGTSNFNPYSMIQVTFLDMDLLKSVYYVYLTPEFEVMNIEFVHSQLTSNTKL